MTDDEAVELMARAMYEARAKKNDWDCKDWDEQDDEFLAMHWLEDCRFAFAALKSAGWQQVLQPDEDTNNENI